MDTSAVHLTVAPLGDWYFHTACGTYASDEWVTCKQENITCRTCAEVAKGGDLEER